MHKSDKKNWFSRTLIGFSLTSFFNDFNHEMITAILPLFVFNLVGKSYVPLVLGLIAGLSTLARSCADLIGGWLGQKIKNQKLLLIIGYSITPLFCSLIGTAKNIITIIFYRTFAWGGRGMREPIRDAWLAEIIDRKDYGKGFGFLRAMDTFGAILGPLVAYFAIAKVTLETIFLIALIPGILSIFSVIFLVKNYYAQEQKRRVKFKEIWASLPYSFKYFLAIRFLFGIAQFDSVLIILRAQEYITGQHITSIVAAGWAILFYTFFNIIRLICEFGIGMLTDYFPKISKRIAIALLGFGTLGISTYLLSFKTIPFALWFIIFMFAAISLACVTVLEKTYTADLVPHHLLPTSYGILLMLIGISSLLAGLIVGGLWSHFSAQTGFAYASIVCFTATFLLLVHKSGN